MGPFLFPFIDRALQKKQIVFPILFVLLLTLPHLSFRFGAKEEKPLPDPYWVEVQNRDAFDTWQNFLRQTPSPNIILAPLQDIRRRSLGETGMVLKVPAFTKEEEVAVLNALKISLLKNQDHQVVIKYEEILLRNSGQESLIDFKGRAKQYHVKLEKTKFNNSNKICKLKEKFIKKFQIREKSPAGDFVASHDAARLSGFSFKGFWRDAFDPSNTRRGVFQAPEDPVPVLMMLKAGYHGYFEEEGFQALDLRYGDGKVSFLIFVPRSDEGLRAFYEDLNFENWNQWMSGFMERQGTVRIPRFKIETLSEACCQLTAFETVEKGGKDFLRYDMTEVLGIEEQFDVNANRPFFFAVRDNETNLILLMGQFADPSASRNQS